MSSPHQHDTDFKDGKEDEKTDHTHDEIVEEGHDHSDSELLAESSPVCFHFACSSSLPFAQSIDLFTVLMQRVCPSNR